MTDESSNQEYIPCDGCGQYFKPDELRRCSDCGKVYCPECRITHTCDEAKERRCDSCGKMFPKDSLMRCTDCGDVLCPDCRKKHDCTGEKGEPKDHSAVPIIVTIIVCSIIVCCVWICVATGTGPANWFAGETIAGTSWIDSSSGSMFEFYPDKTGVMIAGSAQYPFSWTNTGERSYSGGGMSFYLSRNHDSLSVTDKNGVTKNYVVIVK